MGKEERYLLSYAEKKFIAFPQITKLGQQSKEHTMILIRR